MKIIRYLLIGAFSTLFSLSSFAENKILTVAVFDFESKDEGLQNLGTKVASLIAANLSASSQVITVERAELDKALGEQELGLSGTIQPETAAKVGHLTGAQVLVTGRVFKVDKDLIMVSKIIGTETSRVYGEVVTGGAAASPSDMAGIMATKIGKTVNDKADTLIAKVEKIEDRLEKIKKTLKTAKLPVVAVTISERHFGGITIDPAAQTEIAYILQKCGFKVLDHESDEKPAMEFNGEAFSELGMRKGNLVSCKGRIELKILDKASGKLLAIDRQTSVAVDLSEQIAAKNALQKSAQDLMERIIPAAMP